MSHSPDNSPSNRARIQQQLQQAALSNIITTSTPQSSQSAQFSHSSSYLQPTLPTSLPFSSISTPSLSTSSLSTPPNSNLNNNLYSNALEYAAQQINKAGMKEPVQVLEENYAMG
jgi:hypothetical protein